MTYQKLDETLKQLEMHRPARKILCVLFILVTPMIGQVRFSVTAQSHLSDGDTKQATALVSAPSGDPQIAGGLIVFLPKSVKYKISVAFESTAKNDKEKEINQFRQVRIYKPTSKVSANCMKQECWKKVAQISNSTAWDLDSNITEILVTSWTPSFNSTKIGLPDKFKDVMSKTMLSLTKGTVKGVRITFTSSVGLTVVTIMPR